ncbi:PTS family mannose/fructose/sorbose porter component IIA [Lactiplantibacillus plantarum]|nr:PTS family mannose/fructose/sorbose porter component IIA [Lactiplantibacillus plantarum]
MKRGFIVASHRTFSAGLVETLRFFAGDDLNVEVVTAYMSNTPVDEDLERAMAKFGEDDEVVILTDLMAGSVNQKATQYLNRPHTHILTGMNLPLAMALIMEPANQYLTTERIEAIVTDAKNQIVYINQLNLGDKDDEDE